MYQYTNGDAIPFIEKTANGKTAHVGDTLTYAVKLANHKAAACAWKQVVLTDAVPDGLTFADSSVYVDGKSAEHNFKDNVLSVLVGDLSAGESMTVTFDVQVLEEAANSVNVSGKNGSGMATDDGVTVPEVEPQNPTNPTGFYVTKDVDKTVVNVSKGAADEQKTATFTITVGNNSNVTGQSPEIEIISAVDEPVTDIHYQLFNGYGDGKWRPGDRISLQEACTVAYRLIAKGGNTWLERGTVTVPTQSRRKQSILCPSVCWLSACLTRRR